jgi:hypothetical protein
MPFKSLKQNAWAHTAAGTKALGGKKKVKEWESETSYSTLPEKVKPPKSRLRRTSN